jgi:hypothetical protein
MWQSTTTGSRNVRSCGLELAASDLLTASLSGRLFTAMPKVRVLDGAIGFLNSASAHEVQDQHNDPNHQHEMNQSAGDVKRKKSQQPQNNQNGSNHS